MQARFSVLSVLGSLLAGLGLSSVVLAQPVSLDRVVAIVNRDVITNLELTNRVATVKRQTRRQNVQLPPEDELRRQILDRLVYEKVLLLAAKERNLAADERAVDQTVARIAEENRASLNEFRERVERDGTSFASFREEVRNELTIQRLRERETDQRIQISEAEVTAFLAAQAGDSADVEYNLQHILLKMPEGGDNSTADERLRLRAQELVRQLQRGVDFARLANSFSEAPEATEGGMMGWRNAQRLPALFLDAVKNLRPGELAALQKSPNGYHILKLIEKRGASSDAVGLGPVQQTRVRHILIRLNEITSEADATRRLQDIRERVTGGATTFAEMAKQYSADGSAARGGDIGWTYPGDLVPEFERAMNALALNQVSAPVRSPFGLHLIEVLERRTQEASEDRQRLAARGALRERKSSEAFDEWVREQRARAFVELRLDD